MSVVHELATSAASRAEGLAHQRIATVVMIAFFALAPLVAYPVFLMKVMCFALFACAFNLLIGYGGLLSFGHAMFLGTAGYASAHAAKVWGFPPEFAILFGTACSALLGLVTGLLAIRRQGIYFAMITLALAQMMYFFYLQAPFTGGEDGIQAVPRGKLFGVLDLNNAWAMYSLVFAVFGPVVGALIIISMENYLAQIGSWVTVVQGAIFVICVLSFRRGVIGELGRLIRKPL